MKLFPLSLKDKAKTWLNSHRLYHIKNWGDLQLLFLQKFFPTHRTSALKNEISNFKAIEDEKFLHVGKDLGRWSQHALIMDLTTGC